MGGGGEGGERREVRLAGNQIPVQVVDVEGPSLRGARLGGLWGPPVGTTEENGRGERGRWGEG